MKTEQQIIERKIYIEGYIAGQRNAAASYDKEIERAQYEINALDGYWRTKMQDRFKFRCFSRKTKKMYEVDSLHLDSKDGEWVWVHYYNPIYDKDLKIQIEQPNAIIMQCTGLKDKNGKLIYDGDIISFDCTYRNKITNYKFAIVFFNGCFGVFTETNFEPLTQFLDYHCENEKIVYDDCYAEVIGNIYENPELLED